MYSCSLYHVSAPRRLVKPSSGFTDAPIRSRSGPGVLCFALLLVLAGSVDFATGGVVGPPVNDGQNRPNIVLINLDDADREMFEPETLRQYFPAIHSLAKKGISFTNFHVTTPLCGPSRACLFRGQYAHSIDHRTNDAQGANTRGFQGDFKSFMEKGYYDNDIGTWMKQAGYHTAFVGKYINFVDSEKRMPAGWDDFYRSHGSRYYETSRFTNRKRAQGSADKIPSGIYRTDAEAADVVSIVKRRAHGNKPLFVYFAPFGPHSQGKAPGGMIDVQDSDQWRDLAQRTFQDFDEDDISDKPAVYRQLPKLSERMLHKLQQDYRNRMLAVRSVDRAIARIVKTLESQGLLKNTFIFVTSDNGYSLGQHRMSGKGNTMSRSSHVPLVVVGPTISQPQRANHLLAHIDLAPTFLALAGRPAPDYVDGKSFACLLGDGNKTDSRSWRDAILIENWQTRRFTRFTFNTTFCQLRTFDGIYTEWADGTREYYDLANDPLELDNRYSALSQQQIASMSCRIKQLRTPQEAPIVTIESPDESPDESFGKDHRLVRGVAEDSSGVAKVELVIRSSTDQFWNGNQWQLRPCVLAAELLNAGGVQTEWKYRFQLPGNVETFKVLPQAVACNGRRSLETQRQQRTGDTRSPVTRIHNVRFPNGKARITGRAFDNQKVDRVQLHLQNLDNGQYFNGRHWVAECECINCQTNSEHRWEMMTPKLQAGNYQVRARSFDRMGNREESEQVKRFQVK